MIFKAYCPSPIGWFEISGSELGVQKLQRCNSAGTTTENLPPEHPVAQCLQQLQEYFAGKRRYFDVKLDWGGATDFHKQVWGELLKIPFGKTTSYSEIAEQIGHPKAVRAVGLANRSNPIAIVVPCHRVIGKAGELRGYFYGLDTKMLLLRHENPVKYAEQAQLF